MDKLKKRSACLAALIMAAALAVFVAPVLGSREQAFLVRSFSPQGEAPSAAELKAVFSHEAVSEDQVGTALTLAACPFIITPSVSGTGEWTDASTFVFRPAAGRFAPATKYTVSARAGLRDRKGLALSGTQGFSFSTQPLLFIGAKQTDFDQQSGRSVFELEFSLPVSPARLRGYAELRDENGQPLNFSIKPGPASRRLLLTLEALSNKETELRIAAGLPSEAGPLGLEKEARQKLSRSVIMELRDSSAQSGMDGGRIRIETTSPVELSKAAAFIELSPSVKFTVEPEDGGFAIVGAFRPQDRIKVTVKKGLPSASGKTLEKEWSRAFIFPDVPASIRFAEPGRVISPESSMRLALESVNCSKLNVIIWQLFDNNIPLAMRSEWGGYPTELSRVVADREFLVRANPNEKTRRALDLKPLLDGRKGVFLVIVQSRDGIWTEARQTINVTELGLTVKKGADSAVARVLSIEGAKPLSGAKVTLWSWSNQKVGEGITDMNGLARFSLKDEKEAGPAVIALAEKKGDISFVRLDQGLYNGNDDFDTSGMPWLLSGYSAFCYTPRDIFRPGEEIPFFAVVRGKDGRAPTPFPLTLKIYSPTGRLWKSQSAKLSSEGNFFSKILLPPEAPVGAWSFSLCVPGSESPIGYKDLYVEEFAAPRLFVEASSKPTMLIGTEKAELFASARYTFGNPASGLKWEAEQRTEDCTFAPKQWKGFVFRDVELQFVSQMEFIASGALDAAGKASTFFGGGNWKVPSMLRLSVRVGVMEDSGRLTNKTITVPWYPAAQLVGLEAPREARPGSSVSFRAACVTPEGKAAALTELNYSLYRRVRQSVVFETDGRLSRRMQEELVPRGGGRLKLEAGKGKGSVSIAEAGEYILRVETPDGSSRASAIISAWGEGSAGGLFPDAVELTTDKKLYSAGELARVKLHSPFAGNAFLDVETTSSVLRETRTVKAGENIFTIRVTEDMKPNAWITAQVVRPAQKDGAPARAFGVTPLMLDNSKSRLTVTFDKKTKLEPGKNQLSLTVSDSAGKGREALVTVMMVDETVLGLTGYQRPDPWKWFTGRRQLGMETCDLYGSLITPEKGVTPLLTAGGGDGGENMMLKSSLSPVQAQRFRLLSVTAQGYSDSKGRCTVTLTVPEFSGKARLTAVAVTASAEGSGESFTQINRDIVTEIALPRFAAPNDSFEAPCRLFNMTDKTLTVKLTAEGSKGAARLEPLSASSAEVTLKGRGSAVIPFSFKAQGVGVVKLNFVTLWGKGSAAKTVIELPIRPASPRITESDSKLLRPGEKWSFSAPPAATKGDFAEAVVMLSAMPQISLVKLADFLVSYPWGCFEQTVSAAWPLLTQPELVKHSDPALADKKAVAARIAKIEAMQNQDGGFPRWAGESSQPWESLYGAQLLLEARRLGYRVSPDTLKASLEYARALLPVMPDTESDEDWRDTLTRRAYASFVLALAKEAPLGWMESLRDKLPQLSPSGRLLLASAYALAGEKQEAGAILGKEAPALKKRPGGNDNYESELRNAALTLLARSCMDPAGAEAASAAATLISKLQKAPHYSTQEGGFAFAALGRWAAAAPREGAPAGSLTAMPSGKTVGTVSEKKRTVTATAPGGYKAQNSGKARLYAAWSASFIPAGPVPARAEGIALTQKLTERNGKPLGSETTRGTAITATVVLTPKAGALRNVVAVLPLPAGFEIENPRLTGAGENAPAGVREEMRDDRLVIFINELKKPLTVKYSLRAVTEGLFTVPQHYAECMYDPGISAVSGGGTIKINAPK